MDKARFRPNVEAFRGSKPLAPHRIQRHSAIAIEISLGSISRYQLNFFFFQKTFSEKTLRHLAATALSMKTSWPSAKTPTPLMSTHSPFWKMFVFHPCVLYRELFNLSRTSCSKVQSSLCYCATSQKSGSLLARRCLSCWQRETFCPEGSGIPFFRS